MSHAWTRRAAVISILLLGSALAPAQEETQPGGESAAPALEEMEALPRLERALANIRAHVKNASIRVRHVKSARAQAGEMIRPDERVVVNTARDCCSKNVEVIAARLKTVNEAVRELYASHQETRNEEGLKLMGHIGQHVRGMESGFASFAKASEGKSALKALDAMGDEMLHLDRDLSEYRECCVEGGAEVEVDG